MNRSLAIRAAKNDDGTVTFPLSSEAPYRRYDGVEVLLHGAANVDLSFLNSGNAPLLDGHDRFSGMVKQIGVIEKAWVSEKRIYVTVRFSAKANAQEIKQDVIDGIIRNVSVGYEVIKAENDTEGDIYRVVKWKPFEASFVPVPADTTVGIGRSANSNGVRTMLFDKLPGEQTEAEQGAAFESALNDIRALAVTHNIGQIGEAFVAAQVRAGRVPSIEVFRGIARSQIPEGTALKNEDIGLTPKETRQFSVLKLANAMRDGATATDMEAASFEIESSGAARKIADKEGRTSKGSYTLPAELMRSWGSFEIDGISAGQYRAAIGTGAGGANILDTSHLADRFIDNLRNQSGILRAGATMLPGLDNNVEIPGGQANNVAAWLAAEDANVAESNPTFRKITLAPKDLGSFTDLTRRMLQQSTIALEAYVRKQITDGIVLEIDRAALYGTGATGQPTGVNATAGIGSVAFATAATTGIPTRDELIDMRKLVAASNRGVDSLKWIFNTATVGDLMKTRVDAGSGVFLMDGLGDRLLGSPVIDTNQIPLGPLLNDIWLGYWSDMIVGMWGSLDLDRDTAAKFLAGGIRLRGIQTVDIAVQRVGSFVKGT